MSADAVSALSAQTYAREDRGREFGAFAYSPLDPTAAYTSATSRLYPARGAAGNVAATYAGETVAGQGDLFYRGAVEATVFWDPATVTDSKVRVTISDLAEAETGDTLQIGRYVTDSEGNVGPGIADVGSLTWTANIETDEGVVKFSSSDSVRVAPSGLGALPSSRPTMTSCGSNSYWPPLAALISAPWVISSVGRFRQATITEF